MNSWADNAIKELQAGKYATIYPKGNSMKGLIESGSKVVLAPASGYTLMVDDIVLVKVNGRVYLHLIKEINKTNGKYLIGNNVGNLNGWARRDNIYGIVIKDGE